MFVVLSPLAALFEFFCHSERSGYALPEFIHHILGGAHQAKLFSNKIFFLNSVLQTLRLMVLFRFFLKWNFITLLYSINRYSNKQHINKRKKNVLYYIPTSPAGSHQQP